MLTLGSQGLRNLYCKKEIKNLAAIKNVKVRVQATVTEDTLFPAYGAQIVHMPVRRGVHVAADRRRRMRRERLHRLHAEQAL
jgi:hypothetical protein